jgi:hypothetical protein
MKKYILLTLIFWSLASYAQLKTPAQSPSASVSQSIGLTEIEIEYSRPSARGRIIFGENGLLPNGAFWRVGANAATKISFSEDILIQESILKQGVYTVLAKPNAQTWELNWYNYDGSNWNAYVEKEPVLSQTLPVIKTSNLVETMELSFQDVTMDRANLVLAWEHTTIKIPVRVDEKERILKTINSTLSGPNSFEYYQAALYLHETQTNLEEALTYIQKVTAQDDALFFQVTREALILRDLKRNKDAVSVANSALVLSKKAGNNDFVKLNQQLIEALGL